LLGQEGFFQQSPSPKDEDDNTPTRQRIGDIESSSDDDRDQDKISDDHDNDNEDDDDNVADSNPILEQESDNDTHDDQAATQLETEYKGSRQHSTIQEPEPTYPQHEQAIQSFTLQHSTTPRFNEPRASYFIKRYELSKDFDKALFEQPIEI